MPHRLFLPKKNKRSPILSLVSLLFVNIFLLLLILLRTTSIDSTGLKILGFATDINVSELYNKTNQMRIQNGLQPLSYNSVLAKAAEKKALDMFEDDYWAHIAPDGTTPWDFIKGEGYRYTYAGENLARDFNKSDSVVKAWMNSQTHRENLLNPNYTEIGFAVVNGVLNGEKTTLVVQMFGKPVGAKVVNKPAPSGETAEVAVLQEEPSQNVPAPEIAVTNTEKPVSVLPSKDTSLITLDAGYALSFAYFLLGFFLVSLIIDGFVAFKRGHFRLTGNTLSHLVLFISTLLFLLYLNNPNIL